MGSTLHLFDLEPYSVRRRIRTIVWQPRRTALSPGAVAALERLRDTLDNLSPKEKERRQKSLRSSN